MTEIKALASKTSKETGMFHLPLISMRASSVETTIFKSGLSMETVCLWHHITMIKLDLSCFYPGNLLKSNRAEAVEE